MGGKGMDEVDAVVVGGGISGCATAIELARSGWRVVVLHRTDPVSTVESIPHSAVRRLQALSIQSGSILTEVVAWWGSANEIRAHHPGALIVQRAVLGDALRTRATDAGAQLIELGSISAIQRVSAGWEIAFDTRTGSSRRLGSEYLVDGTGRTSVIGRRLGARRLNIDQLFGASVSVSGVDLVGTWTESASNGWWNLSCASGEGTLSYFSTAALVRSAMQDLASVFCKTRHLRRLLSLAEFGLPTIRASGSSRLAPGAGRGWLAVGDAASTLQPLASAGVAKALRDAHVAKYALESPPEDYDSFQRTEFTMYLKELREHYKLERRWPQNPPWSAVPIAEPLDIHDKWLVGVHR